ncbi:hypothetical protein F4803DRAFT_126795 [Xylaria telfairii]|nr:hypothetical protein F4803DRAFT_126795 [Xylaria telfairii]
MSSRPTTATDTLAPVASSASSQKTATVVSETSDHIPWGPGSFTQPSFYRLYPRFPPVVLLPSRAPPTELPTIHHPYPESIAHYADPPLNEDSDWLRCISGPSGRTAHITSIICVVVVITLILVVILVLSLLTKNNN